MYGLMTEYEFFPALRAAIGDVGGDASPLAPNVRFAVPVSAFITALTARLGGEWNVVPADIPNSAYFLAHKYREPQPVAFEVFPVDNRGYEVRVDLVSP